MTNTKFASGAFIFTRARGLQPRDPDDLPPVAARHGIAPAFIPSYAGDRVAIVRAISQASSGLQREGFLLRPIKRSSTEVLYGIVREQKDETAERIDHDFEGLVSWSAEPDTAVVHGDHPIARRLAEAYRELRGKIVADDWSGVITSYLERHDAARVRTTSPRSWASGTRSTTRWSPWGSARVCDRHRCGRCGGEGHTPDVLWDQGVLLVRRSHTRMQEVMETTKTGQHQRLKLPEELMDILRWHMEKLTPGRSETDLLFPPRWGNGFMSASVLDKPFKDVTAALKKEGKLSKKITPRAMRRTFQDLAREAQVRDIVTRAISEHATEQMQRHYSTVNSKEVEESIGKVISRLPPCECLDDPFQAVAGPETSRRREPWKTLE